VQSFKQSPVAKIPKEIRFRNNKHDRFPGPSKYETVKSFKFTVKQQTMGKFDKNARSTFTQIAIKESLSPGPSIYCQPNADRMLSKSPPRKRI